MVATKTRKQEAWELLALDALTDEQKVRVNRLVAEVDQHQVVKDDRGYYRLSRAGVVMGGFLEEADAWAHTPDYFYGRGAIGNCLTLPIPEGAFWKLRTPVMIRAELYGNDGLALAKEFGQTLPIAMLKAWWSIQE